MLEQHKAALKEVEQVLVGSLRPSYLISKSYDTHNHIIMSCPLFRYHGIDDRVDLVLDLLWIRVPELMKSSPLLVECFSSSEITDLLEYTLGENSNEKG